MTLVDRPAILKAADRLRAAAEEAAAAHAPADPSIEGGIALAVTASERAGSAEVPPSWIRGVLENALIPVRSRPAAPPSRGPGEAKGGGA